MRFNQLGRREFITLLGGAAVWPLTARAQQPVMPVVGFLSGALSAPTQHFTTAFCDGLADSGFIDGKNVTIEYRFAEGHLDRLPAQVFDLVRRHVAVIYAAGGDVSILVAKGATATIPIVFNSGYDPVKTGFVASLNRPGGNATGTTVIAGPLGAKRLELLRELVPKASLIAMMVYLNNPSAEPDTANVETAARAVGQKILVVSPSNDEEIDEAFAKLTQAGAGALMVNPDPFFISRPAKIVALAARYAVPTLYYAREYPDSGGLMSYGANFAAMYRQGGNYVGRILKGDKPADLPVVQPTKFELIINLKTAKALGLTVPDSLLARADEVIE
jgi:putative tryptophan/tyrosine transport system substrate-binding protein